MSTESVPKAILCGSDAHSILSLSVRPLAELGSFPPLLSLDADTNKQTDWFPGSVWASVPRLTADEKGFTDHELETRIVDLGASVPSMPCRHRWLQKSTNSTPQRHGLRCTNSQGREFQSGVLEE